MNSNSLSQSTTFKYDGNDANKFIKQIIRMLYDADIDDVVFKDGNPLNLTKQNIWIKCM